MNFRKKRQTVTAEKRAAKLHYRILIGLTIIGILYYLFFEPTTIGHDRRYTFYIFLLPTLSGMVIIGIYRWQFLLHKFSSSKSFLVWAFFIFFYSVQGLLFSYLSFGQVAKISWDTFNERVAKQNPEEIIDCKITKFSFGRRPRIEFLFQDRFSTFRVRYKTIKEYRNENPTEYYLEITARKGAWNYYLVDHWKIKTNATVK